MIDRRRVLAPILMIGVCGLIVAGYKWLAPSRPIVVNVATPASTSTPRPMATPSPRMPLPPSPMTESAALSVGQSAPDFALPSASGDMVTLSSYQRQKNVVLLFYRTGG